MFSEGYEETQAFDENFPFKIAISNSPTKMNAHWHNSIELMYFYDTAGCDYTIKRNHYRINKNHLVVANPLEMHQCHNFGNATVCCLIFPSNILGPYNGIIFNHHIKNDRKINEIFEKIKELAISEQSSFLIMSCIYELVGHMLQNYVFDNESEIKRSRYKPIFKNVDLTIDYIKKHFNENISVSDIARASNLSESRISHVFKEITGITILEYVENTRMNSAIKLLKESDMNITDIAISCGYCDNSYFSLRFRLKNGISPSTYRKQYRNKIS